MWYLGKNKDGILKGEDKKCCLIPSLLIDTDNVILTYLKIIKYKIGFMIYQIYLIN
jgi:hypothetical protein